MNADEITTDITDDTADDAEGHAFRSGRVARPGRDAATDDTADDAEGHAFRSGRAARPGRDAATADTEGHAIRKHVGDAGEGDLVGDADAEGHAARGRYVGEAGEGDLVGDDTEGHLYIPKYERTGGSEPMAMRGKLAPAGEDDTEGHGFRTKP